MNQSRGKRWVATLSVYSQETLDKFDQEFKTGEVLKYICQEEKGEGGFIHLQVFLCFSNVKRFTQVKSFFGQTAHIELAKGNDSQNLTYCSKEASRTGLFISKAGDFDGGQGQRSDLSKVALLVTERKTIEDIAFAFPVEYIKFCKGIERLVGLQRERDAPRHKDMCTIVLYGPSGIGKSLWVRLYAERHVLRVYNKPLGFGRGTQWFDGYDGEEILLLDDFDSDQVSYRELLVWLDVYKCKVAVKGGFVSATWNYVCITTNVSPDTWYRGFVSEEGRLPLVRRLDHVYVGIQQGGYLSGVYPVAEKRIGRRAFEGGEGKED